PEDRRQCPVSAEQRQGVGGPCPRREESGDEEGDCLQALDHEVEGSHRLSHGAAEVTARPFSSVSSVALCVLCAVLLPSFGTAQGRITNAKTETRSAAQGLEREVRAV